MDIENLGPAIIEQLMAAELLKSIADLYRLTLDKVAALERMGTKSAEKLLQGIEQSKTRGLERLLGGLGIRHIGTRTAVLVATHFASLDALRGATAADFEVTDGIGPVAGQSLYDFLHKLGGLALLEELAQLGVSTNAMRDQTQAMDGPLSGKTVVVTGTLEKFTRSQIKSLIEKLGGKAGETVSKSTALVLAGAEAGGKLEKARKLNIPILDEQAFLEAYPDAAG